MSMGILNSSVDKKRTMTTADETTFPAIVGTRVETSLELKYDSINNKEKNELTPNAMIHTGQTVLQKLAQQRKPDTVQCIARGNAQQNPLQLTLSLQSSNIQFALSVLLSVYTNCWC